jgi:anaerobic dimethyl sulfoxide reductase subunit B (iron-sulfur subunit)
MLKRPTFFLDTQICTGCKTCIIACKDKNNLPEGVRWRRVVEFAGGDWILQENGTVSQNVFAYYISVGCNHCRDPICEEVCPSTAMHRDDRSLVTIDLEKCVGCRYCEWACPYSAPQFDATIGQMTKCDFCQDELEQERTPACVAACPTRALQFGEYEALAARQVSDRIMAPLPPRELTDPNFILAPHRDTRTGHTRNGTICNPEEVRDA